MDYDLAELEQRQYSNQYQSLTRYSPVCSTSHTRKRRFMLVPGPPLLYEGFAFYNWDILESKKADFSLTLWQEQSFPFAKVKRRCWLSAGWPMLSAKIERSHLSIHNFLHPALWMHLHRQRECVSAASQLKCNFIVVAYLIFRRLCKNLFSCVPLPKNNKTKLHKKSQKNKFVVYGSASTAFSCWESPHIMSEGVGVPYHLVLHKYNIDMLDQVDLYKHNTTSSRVLHHFYFYKYNSHT